VTWDLGGSDKDAWRAVNAELSAAPPPPRRRPWWRRHLRWLLLALAVDLLAGTLLWRWLQHPAQTPERAVVRLAGLVHDKDWAGVRASLCAPDRARYTTQDVAQAGQAALLVLRGVDTFRVRRVVTVPDVALGPVGLPARRVEGDVVALLGPPSAAHVTVVLELRTWKACLSAGGYGADALGVDVPPGQDLLGR
jgi:hypothetical protein